MGNIWEIYGNIWEYMGKIWEKYWKYIGQGDLWEFPSGNLLHSY